MFVNAIIQDTMHTPGMHLNVSESMRCTLAILDASRGKDSAPRRQHRQDTMHRSLLALHTTQTPQ